MPPEYQMPPFLPTTRQEAGARGWPELDVIFISGDAYVDHPSFAVALLGRMLEAEGYRVGVIARPRRDHPEDVTRLGEPKLFFAVAPGAVDSMINNYTAQKRKRRTDDYAPGGVGGDRPNRALIYYCNLLRQAFGKRVLILGGGVEASLRRFSHYDFWDDAVRRSVLLDAPADALIYGMGERPLMEIARALSARVEQGAVPAEAFAALLPGVRGVVHRGPASAPPPEGFQMLPPHEEVAADPRSQVRLFVEEMRYRPHGVYQDCAGHRVIANPPAATLTTADMDALYNLAFRRQAHPSYKERIPALEQVQFSITSHRGCFGGCAFCGIFTHQGKTVQSRSRGSILREVREMVRHPQFPGTIRDIGGPTANMWGMHCGHTKPCARPSCLAPSMCEKLMADGKPYTALLDAARRVPGVKHLFISSGVRMDLALQCESFLQDFARHYTSGHAKVAPEHVVPEVLDVMMKPDGRAFLNFLEKFRQVSERARKRQFVLPYFIAGHPGCRMEDMIEVALFLVKQRMRVEQCQIFIPIPGTASAVMYATGVNPYTGKSLYVEREVRRREMQKALVLYHLPESRGLVREALKLCERADLEPALLHSGPLPRPAVEEAKPAVLVGRGRKDLRKVRTDVGKARPDARKGRADQRKAPRKADGPKKGYRGKR